MLVKLSGKINKQTRESLLSPLLCLGAIAINWREYNEAASNPDSHLFVVKVIHQFMPIVNSNKKYSFVHIAESHQAAQASSISAPLSLR